MAGVKVVIENEREVKAAIEAAGLSVQAILAMAVEAGAEVAASIATERAPGEIKHEMDSQKTNTASAHVGPPKDKWYYRFLEFGTQPHTVGPNGQKALKLLPLGEIYAAWAVTGGVAAEPFLRPAIDEGEEDISAAVGKPIKAVIDG